MKYLLCIFILFSVSLQAYELETKDSHFVISEEGREIYKTPINKKPDTEERLYFKDQAILLNQCLFILDGPSRHKTASHTHTYDNFYIYNILNNTKAHMKPFFRELPSIVEEVTNKWSIFLIDDPEGGEYSYYHLDSDCAVDYIKLK